MQFVSLIEIKPKILKMKIPCNIPFHNAFDIFFSCFDSSGKTKGTY